MISSEIFSYAKVISLPLRKREIDAIPSSRMTSRRNLFAQVVPTSTNTQKMTAYDFNIYFETVMKFGTEEQPLNLVVDTGSSWTWVLTDQCVDIDDCVDHNSFHYLMSDTFSTSTDTKKITYGDRVTEGLICKEDV